MTREEAIEQLQNCKGLIKQDGKDWLDERDIPLIDMAIEALKENKSADSLLNAEAEADKESECKLSREDARYFLQGISDMFSLSPEAEMSIDMAISALQADVVSREEYEEVKAYMDTLVDAFIEDGEELAESVEVVRCKDCKYRQNDLTHNFCEINYHKCYDDDFCSWAERRE